MRVGDKLWTNWNKAPMRLWQTQLNFTVWCAASSQSNDWVGLSISCLLSREASTEKITDSIATRDQF